MNKQLIPRDLVTNLGQIVIRGSVNKSGVDYDELQVILKRDGSFYDSKNETLNYVNDIATFDFKFNIVAEKSNYYIEVYGVKSSNLTLEHSIESIVAGDVFIIQGQSNAESRIRNSDSSYEYDSEFIRVYANGSETGSNLLINGILVREMVAEIRTGTQVNMD